MPKNAYPQNRGRGGGRGRGAQPHLHLNDLSLLDLSGEVSSLFRTPGHLDNNMDIDQSVGGAVRGRGRGGRGRFQTATIINGLGNGRGHGRGGFRGQDPRGTGRGGRGGFSNDVSANGRGRGRGVAIGPSSISSTPIRGNSNGFQTPRDDFQSATRIDGAPASGAQPATTEGRNARRKNRQRGENLASTGAPADINPDGIIEVDFNDFGRVLGVVETAPEPVFFEDPYGTYDGFRGGRGQARGGFRGRGARGNRGGLGTLPAQGGPQGGRGRGRGRGGYHPLDISIYDTSFHHPQEQQATTPSSFAPNTSRNRAEKSELMFRNFRNARLGMNPYLRPIVFVKAAVTDSILFMNEEEIFRPEVVDMDKDADTAEVDAMLAGPTADTVEKLFHRLDQSDPSSSSSSSSDEDDAEAVEKELAVVVEEKLSLQQSIPVPGIGGTTTSHLEVEAEFSSRAIVVDDDDDGDDVVLVVRQAKRTVIVEETEVQPEKVDQEVVPAATNEPRSEDAPVPEHPVGIDSVGDMPNAMEIDPSPIVTPSGADIDATSIENQPTATAVLPITDITINTEATTTTTTAAITSTSTVAVAAATTRTAKSKSKKSKHDRARRSKAKPTSRGLGYHQKSHNKFANLNRKPIFRNQSDIDWSTESGSNADEDEYVDEDHGGMDIDPELLEDDGTGGAIYAKFVERLVGGVKDDEGQAAWDAADLDRDKIRGVADNDSDSDDDSDDDGDIEEAIMRSEEKMMGGKDLEEDDWVDDDESSDSDSDSDDGGDPSFESRLAKLRAQKNGNGRGKSAPSAGGKTKSKGKGKARAQDYTDDDSDEVDVDGDHLFIGKFQWDEDDEDGEVDVGKRLQDLLDANDDIMMSGGKGNKKHRKARNDLFKQILNGDFLYEDELMVSSSRAGKKKKGKRPDWLPSELEDQWDRDRAKKAENKRKRAEALREALIAGNTAQYPGLKMKKNKKKLDINFNNRNHQGDPGGPSLAQVERQIRAFVDDDEKRTLSLPPMEKGMRAAVHNLAECFRLKSKSTGKEGARATMLSKTGDTVIGSRGYGVNEKKIERIINKGAGAAGWGQGKRKGKGAGGGAGAGAGVKKQRDGDVVGAHAKRIDGSNVGFKLLQSMGWSEGARIGASASGIAVPLKAVIKNTKAGLGA
ncbi:hypothetical protein FRB94_002339 [Tulasnella sp. JGI-2019a]|nr:hypothetical protein FRB94_002339 [Tulasnella sp. JGI-2019a]